MNNVFIQIRVIVVQRLISDSVDWIVQTEIVKLEQYQSMFLEMAFVN